MRVLGIETSCDETGISLIEASGDFGESFSYKVLGNALISQAALHAQFGGVFPNLAKREHQKNLVPLLKNVLDQAWATAGGSTSVDGIETIVQRETELLPQLIEYLKTHTKPAIDAIAVTNGPGLEPALWVGVNFAKALAHAWQLPLIAVNHMEGHVVLAMMKNTGVIEKFDFPLLSLLISGGHTELVLSKEFFAYERIGQTRDDAVGEAFDKVARLLGLGYPGGPEISRLAAEARKNAVAQIYRLPRPMMSEDNFDFSFAGLKTAVRKIVEAEKDMTEEKKMVLAREFEEAAADVLVGKALRAAEHFGAHTILSSGGVSANTFIREELSKRGTEAGLRVLIPEAALSTDNALMIALAGYFHALKKEYADPAKLEARGQLKLGGGNL